MGRDALRSREHARPASTPRFTPLAEVSRFDQSRESWSTRAADRAGSRTPQRLWITGAAPGVDGSELRAQALGAGFMRLQSSSWADRALARPSPATPCPVRPRAVSAMTTCPGGEVHRRRTCLARPARPRKRCSSRPRIASAYSLRNRLLIACARNRTAARPRHSPSRQRTVLPRLCPASHGASPRSPSAPASPPATAPRAACHGLVQRSAGPAPRRFTPGWRWLRKRSPTEYREARHHPDGCAPGNRRLFFSAVVLVLQQRDPTQSALALAAALSGPSGRHARTPKSGIERPTYYAINVTMMHFSQAGRFLRHGRRAPLAWAGCRNPCRRPCRAHERAALSLEHANGELNTAPPSS